MTDVTASTGEVRRPLPGSMRYALCAIVAGIVLVLDQATKLIATETLEANAPPVDTLLPLVEWRLLTNPDAAFGIPGFTGMFLVVTVLVVVLIARVLPRTDRLSMAVAYGLVVGGALGNAGDRLFRGFPDGEVVDFISIGFWPVFNLADTGIVIGAAMIIGLLLRADREARRRERAAADHESVRPQDGSPQGAATSTSGRVDDADHDPSGSTAGTAAANHDEASARGTEVAADERR